MVKEHVYARGSSTLIYTNSVFTRGHHTFCGLELSAMGEFVDTYLVHPANLAREITTQVTRSIYNGRVGQFAFSAAPSLARLDKVALRPIGIFTDLVAKTHYAGRALFLEAAKGRFAAEEKLVAYSQAWTDALTAINEENLGSYLAREVPNSYKRTAIAWYHLTSDLANHFTSKAKKQ